MDYEFVNYFMLKMMKCTNLSFRVEPCQSLLKQIIFNIQCGFLYIIIEEQDKISHVLYVNTVILAIQDLA